MPHRKKSRIDLDFDISRVMKRTKPLVVRNKAYDWNKLLSPEVLKRNIWLSNVWAEIYSKNPQDEFIRKLSTDDMLKTKWFEKYGFKEPINF